MQFLFRLIITAIAAAITAYLLPGVDIDSAVTALLVAMALAVLNALVKPVLVFLTLPITVVTLGLFLIVINAIIIIFASKLVPGFSIDGFWWAVLFSFVLSAIVALFTSLQDSFSRNN